MAKSLMSESLQLVHNYATTGDHYNDRSALLEEVESMLDEYKDALEPGYITEEEELILSYFDNYFNSDSHELIMEEEDYINAINRLEESVTEETEELNEFLGAVRQAVGGVAKKILGRGNEPGRLRATGNTGLGKATFAKKHLPTAVAGKRAVGRGVRSGAKGVKGAVSAVASAPGRVKKGIKGYVAGLRQKSERRKAAKLLYKGRDAMRNQRKVARSGDAVAIAKNAAARKGAASVIGQRAKGALGGSASARKQVARAKAGTSNIGLRARRSGARQVRPSGTRPPAGTLRIKNPVRGPQPVGPKRGIRSMGRRPV